MSKMTLSKLADLILDTVDPYKSGESKYSKQWVQEQILIAKNRLQDMDAEKAVKKNQEIEQAWFSPPVVAEIQYDSDAEQFYCEVPSGMVQLTYDMGIRVLPYAGRVNPFVRFPSGWCSLRPDLSFAEGNIVYEINYGRVVFPMMHVGDIGSGKVKIQVISDAPPKNSETPLAMPSRFEDTCVRMVLELMGHYRGEDRKSDGKPGDTQ